MSAVLVYGPKKSFNSHFLLKNKLFDYCCKEKVDEILLTSKLNENNDNWTGDSYDSNLEWYEKYACFYQDFTYCNFCDKTFIKKFKTLLKDNNLVLIKINNFYLCQEYNFGYIIVDYDSIKKEDLEKVNQFCKKYGFEKPTFYAAIIR